VGSFACFQTLTKSWQRLPEAPPILGGVPSVAWRGGKSANNEPPHRFPQQLYLDMEEYKGNFIFTSNNPPPGLDANTWQELWDQFRLKFEAGELPINEENKIPQKLHHIYYSVEGWNKFDNDLPERKPKEVNLSNGKNISNLLIMQKNIVNSILTKYGNDAKFTDHRAMLIKLDLFEENLIRVNFANAQLQGAMLAYAKLHGAILARAELQGSDLSHARLFGADLSGAHLQGANLFGAQLQGANLFEAQCERTQLSQAQMQGAELRQLLIKNSFLKSAQFHGANLTATNFYTNYLKPEQIEGVIIGYGTDDLSTETTFNFSRIQLDNKSVLSLVFRHNMWGKWRPRNKAYYFFERIYSKKFVINPLEKQAIRSYFIKNLRTNQESTNYWTDERLEKLCQNLRIAQGVREGVNGLYYVRNESVAFFDKRKEADSMKGNSLAVVLDNLKRARWQLGISMLMLALMVLAQFVVNRRNWVQGNDSSLEQIAIRKEQNDALKNNDLAFFEYNTLSNTFISSKDLNPAKDTSNCISKNSTTSNKFSIYEQKTFFNKYDILSTHKVETLDSDNPLTSVAKLNFSKSTQAESDLRNHVISLFGIELSQHDFLYSSNLWPLISLVMLLLVVQNMKTALDQARYLKKREDVTQVAGFPWPLSVYNRKPNRERNYDEKLWYNWSFQWGEWGLRELLRFFYSFHPLLLLWFLFPQNYPNMLWGLWFAYLVVLGFLCIWVFRLSKGFQKPILFDPNVKRKKKKAAAKKAEEDAKKAQEAHNAQVTIAKELKELKEHLQKQAKPSS
jgi:uncharacterized protein YjbI with pentapeptide repeats